MRFPLKREGITYRFREIAMRHGDFAVVSLAAAIGTDQVELGIGGVADRPQRLQSATWCQHCPMRSIKPPGRSMHKTTCRPVLPIAAN